MMRVVARRAGQTDETVTQFDAPITDYITVRCSITQTSQMTELHMQFDDDADMSVFARSVPPRLSDAAQAGA